VGDSPTIYFSPLYQALNFINEFCFFFHGEKIHSPSDRLTAAEGYKSLDFEQSLILMKKKNNLFV